MLKMKKWLKAQKYKVLGFTAPIVMSCSYAFADTATTTGLDADIEKLVSGFGGDVKAMSLTMLKLLIPIGLTLWGIGFAAKKGINFLQRKAEKVVQ